MGGPRKNRIRPAIEALDGRRLPSSFQAPGLLRSVVAAEVDPGRAPASAGQGEAIPARGDREASVMPPRPGRFAAGAWGARSVGAFRGRGPIALRLGGLARPDAALDAPATPLAEGMTVDLAAAMLPTAGLEPDAEAEADPSGAEARIVELTNREREKAGLGPLRISDALAEAAQIQSDQMAGAGRLAHDLPGSDLPNLTSRLEFVGYGFARAGENIGFNYADADAAVAGWIGSQAHRANMLDPNVTELGVGVAFDDRGAPYYTQVFGRPA